MDGLSTFEYISEDGDPQDRHPTQKRRPARTDNQRKIARFVLQHPDHYSDQMLNWARELLGQSSG
jgi:hypothetical protein